MELAYALLLYPGLGLAIVLGFVWAWLLDDRRGYRARPGLRALRSIEGVVGLAGMGLSALGLALLPWPLHPIQGWAEPLTIVLAWGAIEGAFLLPLLPALLSTAPAAARAAARELQIGAAGRAIFWLATGGLLGISDSWEPVSLAGRLVLLLAGLAALPAAAGLGIFAAERSLGRAGPEEGLDEPTAGLLRFARTVRGATLLGVLLASGAAGAPVEARLLLAILVALFVLAALVYRMVMRGMPRMTLVAALRWCWWRGLPLALAGLVLGFALR